VIGPSGKGQQKCHCTKAGEKSKAKRQGDKVEVKVSRAQTKSEKDGTGVLKKTWEKSHRKQKGKDSVTKR